MSQAEARDPHVTLAECEAALPHILAAPKDAAPIELLCFRSGYGERLFPLSLTLTPEQGIPGERWLQAPWMRLPDGTPDPRIQVSILSRRVLDLVWRNRRHVPHPGDTMIVDLDLTEENLPAGTRLQAGSAVLEVSDLFNDACAKWKVRYGRESYDWINRPENRRLRLRGILCRIVEGGEVRKGDPLTKLPAG